MLSRKGLAFKLIVLKSAVERTHAFKLRFLDEILQHGPSIEEVEMHEDRPAHRDQFERHLEKLVNTYNEKDGTFPEQEPGQVSEGSRLREYKIHFVEMPATHLDKTVEEDLVNVMLEEKNRSNRYMTDYSLDYVFEEKLWTIIDRSA